MTDLLTLISAKGLVLELVNEFEVFGLSGEEYAVKSGGVEVVVNDGEFLVGICLEIEKFVVEGRNIGLVGLKWM